MIIEWPLLSSIYLYDLLFVMYFKEAVQLSDKLRLFDSKFYNKFDGVDIFCQKLTLLAWGAF